MTIYTINPNTWTKIGDGDCVVISDNKTELDAKDVLIEQSIADNALADSELDGLVSTLSTDLGNLTLRVTALEDVPKVVVLTQEDYDALLEKEVGTLYVIGVLG